VLAVELAGLAAMAPATAAVAGERESRQRERQNGEDGERLLGCTDLEAWRGNGGHGVAPGEQRRRHTATRRRAPAAGRARARAQARAEAGAELGRAGFVGRPGMEAAAHQGGENDFPFLFQTNSPNFTVLSN
jgi:hypothetical protein